MISQGFLSILSVLGYCTLPLPECCCEPTSNKSSELSWCLARWLPLGGFWNWLWEHLLPTAFVVGVTNLLILLWQSLQLLSMWSSMHAHVLWKILFLGLCFDNVNDWTCGRNSLGVVLDSKERSTCLGCGTGGIGIVDEFRGFSIEGWRANWRFCIGRRVGRA